MLALYVVIGDARADLSQRKRAQVLQCKPLSLHQAPRFHDLDGVVATQSWISFLNCIQHHDVKDVVWLKSVRVAKEQNQRSS